MTDIWLRYLVITTLAIALLLVAAVLYIYHKAKQKNNSLRENCQLSESRKDELVKYESKVRKLIEEIKSEKSCFDKETLVAASEKFRGSVLSGQQIVDAIIAYKWKYCEDHDIVLKLIMRPLPYKDLNDEEYVGIFGNLIDNAIEAARKTENPVIQIESITARNQWILKIINTKLKTQHPLETNFATTKGDSENHGLGNKIVRKIVHRHKGAVDFSDKGDYFETIVVIPVIQEQNS